MGLNLLDKNRSGRSCSGPKVLDEMSPNLASHQFSPKPLSFKGRSQKPRPLLRSLAVFGGFDFSSN